MKDLFYRFLGRERNVLRKGPSTILTDFKEVVLRVENTNHCNFKCSFCTHSELVRNKGYISDRLYEKIVREGADLGFKKLDLRNMGEPLLDRDLESKVRLAKSLGYENIYIHSNGYLLDRLLFERLVAAGMTTIILSLSPRREFEETRGKFFDRVEQNLMEISASPARGHLMIDFISSGLATVEEVDEFKQSIQSLGLVLREEIQLHNWANGKEEDTFSGPCFRLWNSFTVLFDGQVALCCLDYEGRVNLGDMNRDSLARVINSAEYQRFRAEHLSRNPSGLCRMCDMVKVKDRHIRTK